MTLGVARTNSISLATMSRASLEMTKKRQGKARVPLVSAIYAASLVGMRKRSNCCSTSRGSGGKVAFIVLLPADLRNMWG